MKDQFIEFLQEAQRPAKKTGLYRMKNLMDKLGNPQDKLDIIHVAGTNGKGSVCSMVTSILMESGYKVGLFTSPHLVNIRERIQVQGQVIDEKDFIETGLRIKKACEKMANQGEDLPIFFEVITAMAFIYFYNENVDIVVLETGIGGKYDASNIIKKPLLSAITSIDMDHTSYLGSSIEEISREKGGIIKKNCPVVLYNSDKLVYNIIEEICRKNNSKLFSCKNCSLSNEEYNIIASKFDVKCKCFEYKDVHLQLLGKYQLSNAVTSLMIVECIKSLGFNILRDNVYKGLKNAKWPGRMEIVEKTPTIILDGAHNRQSAAAFIDSIKSIINNRKIHILISVIEGKDFKSILDILLPHVSGVTVTQSSYYKSLPAKSLYDEIKKRDNHPPIIMEENPIKAYEISRNTLNNDGVLCCVGSLYLIGELKEYLK